MPFSSPQMQRRWKALPGEPVGDAGDVYTGYDRFGRVERMRWGKVGDGGSFTPLVDVGWGHSPASQKTWRKDVLAPATTQQDQKFDYDALYQLTQRQRGLLNVNMTSAGGVPAQQEDFDYDETGNWKGYQRQASGTTEIDQTRVNNRSNQITQVDGSSAGISYDANGNMLTVPTGDALTDPSNRIVWDGWNRPVKVYDAAENLLAEYRYDGLGRRVTVTSGGTTRHTYYDDQWRSIEERLDASTTAERQHIWHPADRWEMILRDRSTANNGVMDERLYPMKDQLDPVAIADDTGSVVERFSYSAFGIPTFLNADFTPKAPNASSYFWSFLFHAEFQDAETGWFNYGYRYYDPQLGRWLSRDPIGEEGGVNFYMFLQNNGNGKIDPLGLRVVTIDITYNFPEGLVTERVKKEFERIFNDCFALCKCIKHTVKFAWNKTNKKCNDVTTGTSGTTMGTGFNPTKVMLCAQDAPNQGVTGYNKGYCAWINTEKLAGEVGDKELGLAVVLAHELGFHGIGGDSDWMFGTPEDWAGNKEGPEGGKFVDSKKPSDREGIQFSKQACKEICDELDID